MDLNWKKGDFEVRTTTDFNGDNYTELIKWKEDSSGRKFCFTLAYFHKNSDGNVSLNFVDDRPFTELAEIDINEIWKELFLTQLMLEEHGQDN